MVKLSAWGRRAGDLAHLHPGGDPVGRRRRPGDVTRGGHPLSLRRPAPPVPGGAGPVRSGCCAPEDRAALSSSPVDCRSYTKPAQALDDSSSRPGWFPRLQRLHLPLQHLKSALNAAPFSGEPRPRARSILSRQRPPLAVSSCAVVIASVTDQPHPRPRSKLGRQFRGPLQGWCVR